MTEAEKNMERELLGAVDNALKDQGYEKAAPTSLRVAIAAAAEDKGRNTIPMQRPQTLADQVGQMERIEHQIADRLRREMVEANAEADRKVAEAHAHYERQLSEETARLQRERDETVRQAIEGYYTKRNELESLLRRRG